MEQAAISTTEKLPNDWDFTKGLIHSFSSNDVIDAYLIGKHEGGKEARIAEEKKIVKTFIKKMNDAGKITGKIVAYLKRKKVGYGRIFLRSNSSNLFELCIVVEEKDFVSDSFLSIYNQANRIENQNSDESFSIHISFAPNAQNFNYQLLNSDGFLWEYKNPKTKVVNEKKAR